MTDVDRLSSSGLAVLAWCAFSVLVQAQSFDPAEWGSDHVGKPLPEFTSGDECLFCHRMDIGPRWSTNRHGQTIHPADPQSPELSALNRSASLRELATQVEWILGGTQRVRFLKRSEAHGRLDLLTTQWKPAQSNSTGQLINSAEAHWDSQRFGDRCAGCHASGTDSSQRTFTAHSLDCFVCHGAVPEKHTSQPALVFLSPQRSDPAVVVTSICGQCHLRTGESRSTGLPYPNHFVAGDNLFRDFRVDLRDAAITTLNPADRHVQENVRDVVVRGQKDVTCLSCHDVHSESSKKHYLVADNGICLNCHTTEETKNPIRYDVHSSVCEY